MRIKIYALFVLSILFALGCNPEWEEHYTSYQETVDENVWDAMQNNDSIAQFVELIKEYKLDTLFSSDITYTIFAFTGDAMDAYLDTIDLTLLKYHICSQFINPASIDGKRKIQTLTEKFIVFEGNRNVSLVDGIVISGESPLYRNGKYFIVDQVIVPKPNLYEFYKISNPILADYIDQLDSVVLNKELSTPIGYDSLDNTVYDSVIDVINIFEEEYFEVKHEFRDRAATIVFPLEEDYNAALNVMAENLGSKYNDYKDIPLSWQNEILMPVLIEHGIFLYRLEASEFIPGSGDNVFRMMNILGDSVNISYTPVDRTECSNGYAYNYQDFQVPDSLYAGGNRFEGEFLTEVSAGKLGWAEGVKITSTNQYLPNLDYVKTASNDTILNVTFPLGYTGAFSVEFKTQDLFPRDYVMEIKTHMRVGGIYDIYVNDELLRTFDYYEYNENYDVMESVVPGEWYIPDSKNLNSFDMFVTNIQEYGPATIRMEYKGPGQVVSNGFVIDYIEFRPYNE